MLHGSIGWPSRARLRVCQTMAGAHLIGSTRSLAFEYICLAVDVGCSGASSIPLHNEHNHCKSGDGQYLRHISVEHQQVHNDVPVCFQCGAALTMLADER